MRLLIGGMFQMFLWMTGKMISQFLKYSTQDTATHTFKVFDQ